MAMEPTSTACRRACQPAGCWPPRRRALFGVLRVPFRAALGAIGAAACAATGAAQAPAIVPLPRVAVAESLAVLRSLEVVVIR